MGSYLTSEEKQKRMEELLREALRQAIDEGVINQEEDVAMVADFVMVLDTIDTEGEPGTAMIHPFDQRTPEALKLVSIAKICVEEGVRDWLRGDDE